MQPVQSQSPSPRLQKGGKELVLEEGLPLPSSAPASSSQQSWESDLAGEAGLALWTNVKWEQAGLYFPPTPPQRT